VIPRALVENTSEAMGTTLLPIIRGAGAYQASYLISGLHQVVVETVSFKDSHATT
jgi:hypothetical protein